MRNHLTSIFVIGLFILFAIGSSTLPKNISYTSQIPPEWSKTVGTLLVMSHKHGNGYNTYMKKNFKEVYTGDYLVIEPNELVNYPIDKYRYIFDAATDGNTVVHGAGAAGGGGLDSHWQSEHAFFIIDRVTNKKYQTQDSGAYSKLMRGFLKALDDARH